MQTPLHVIRLRALSCDKHCRSWLKAWQRVSILWHSSKMISRNAYKKQYCYATQCFHGPLLAPLSCRLLPNDCLPHTVWQKGNYKLSADKRTWLLRLPHRSTCNVYASSDAWQPSCTFLRLVTDLQGVFCCKWERQPVGLKTAPLLLRSQISASSRMPAMARAALVPTSSFNAFNVPDIPIQPVPTYAIDLDGFQEFYAVCKHMEILYKVTPGIEVRMPSSGHWSLSNYKYKWTLTFLTAIALGRCGTWGDMTEQCMARSTAMTVILQQGLHSKLPLHIVCLHQGSSATGQT